MTINPITNQAELNGQEVHLLRRLDEALETGNQAVIGTQYGDATIAKGKDADGKTWFVAWCGYETADGVTGSTAFLKLADKLRGAN